MQDSQVKLEPLNQSLPQDNPIVHQNNHKKQVTLSGVLKKIVTKVLDSLAFGDQFNQIKNRKKILQKNISEVFQQKDTGNCLNRLNYELQVVDAAQIALEIHVKGVSSQDKAKIILKKTISKMLFLRTFIVQNGIHPALSELKFEALYRKNAEKDPYKFAVKDKMGGLNESILQGQVSRFNFYTKDHQQLDGCIVYAKPDEQDESKPTMVMSCGNLMTYEQWLQLAKDYATRFNINVMLYNPRGLGHSLGHMHTTGEGVEDAKAAIRHALRHFCEDKPQRLAVFGHSLGGGYTTEALKQIKQEDKIEVGLYVNSHSISSIDGFISGLFNDNKVIPKILKILMKVFGLNTLNSTKTLNDKTQRIANHTIVLTGELDDVMKGRGRLGSSLENRVDLTNETMPNIGHDEPEFYLAPDSTLDSKNSDTLDKQNEVRNKYQLNIFTWVMNSNTNFGNVFVYGND